LNKKFNGTDGDSLRLTSALIDLHVYAVSYIFISKSNSVNKEIEGFFCAVHSVILSAEPARQDFNRASEKYDDLSNTFFQFLMEFVYYVHDGEVVKRITSYTNKARSFNTTAGLQNMELSELTEISSEEELIKRRT
jgi:hypothetical protein